MTPECSEFVILANKDLGFILEGSFHYWVDSKRKAKKLFKKAHKSWTIIKIK